MLRQRQHSRAYRHRAAKGTRASRSRWASEGNSGSWCPSSCSWRPSSPEPRKQNICPTAGWKRRKENEVEMPGNMKREKKGTERIESGGGITICFMPGAPGSFKNDLCAWMTSVLLIYNNHAIFPTRVIKIDWNEKAETATFYNAEWDLRALNNTHNPKGLA